jgi:putative radical SAM enzyme (TIGR03279 family)
VDRIRSDKHPGLRNAPGAGGVGIELIKVPESLRALLAPGERILGVDEHAIEDILDFHYYTSLSLEPLLKVQDRAGKVREFEVAGDTLAGAELEFEPLTFKTCGNDCVFCFIHQMPRGLREDLYLMDEDYRLGFLYGNYVTMALIREHEMKRILTQRLSPVYLSVHATDMALRNRLLGLKKSRDIMKTIDRLLEGGIEIHTQIVLLPGWNDGPALDKTISDLAAKHPGIASIGIVPVGLSGHRVGLTKLEGFDGPGLGAVVDQVNAHRERLKKQMGDAFVHLADEFFLGAGLPLPAREEYEEFPLLDNGIGMAREFIDAVGEEVAGWEAPARPLRVGLLTGRLGELLLTERVLPLLADLPGLELQIVGLDNKLFGPRITVSGLLPGKDLLAGAAQLGDGTDLLLIPPNTLNADDLFLDDISLAEFREQVGLPLRVPESGFLNEIRKFMGDTA